MTRTCDTRFRKPLLYPLSYGGGTAGSYPPAGSAPCCAQGMLDAVEQPLEAALKRNGSSVASAWPHPRLAENIERICGYSPLFSCASMYAISSIACVR